VRFALNDLTFSEREREREREREGGGGGKPDVYIKLYLIKI